MHDRDPFRAPRREPKPGTFHRPAHGFGTKPAPEAADLRLSDPKVGEQKLEARRGSAGIAPWRCPNEEKAVTRPVGRLPTRRLTLKCPLAAPTREFWEETPCACRSHQTSCRDVHPGEHEQSSHHGVDHHAGAV
jgi:hypothetical protein